MSDINLRLRSIGVDLPRPNPAAGHYRPYLSAAGLLSISGQTCKRDGELVYRGKVGRELDRLQAKEAARTVRPEPDRPVERCLQGELESIGAVPQIDGIHQLHGRLRRAALGCQWRVRPFGRSFRRARSTQPIGDRRDFTARRLCHRGRRALPGDRAIIQTRVENR